jgi:hypothetical protein
MTLNDFIEKKEVDFDKDFSRSLTGISNFEGPSGYAMVKSFLRFALRECAEKTWEESERSAYNLERKTQWLGTNVQPHE